MVCNLRRTLAAGAFAVLGAFLVGCANSEAPPATPPAAQPTPPESAGGHDDHDHKPAGPSVSEEDRKLYLTPGGKYTEADIKANGGAVAAAKFKGIKATHDVEPQPGDVLCPISMTKANPKFPWVVGGKTYQFCCPPCVDEFVALAKEKPDAVREPEFYRKE
jgi:hypothetical protein